MSLGGVWGRRFSGSRGARRRSESIIERMVIDMNEAQVRTLEHVRQVVSGTQAREFRRAENDEGRYAWIALVLRRFEYGRLKRPDRGVVLVYLQRLSGYSRAQVKRLVATWQTGEPLVKRYRAPEHAFARRYTGADVALLAEVDRAMNTLSGPATACVLRRQRDVFGDTRFERLGSISVGHLYNLRNSAPYRAQRVVLTKTRPTKSVTIGVRKAPAPDGRAGFIRIDSDHQGDWDGTKGLYHINAVDCQGHEGAPAWPMPVAGGGHRADDFRGPSAARHQADARAVPYSDPRVPRRQRQRVRQPPSRQDARQAAHRVHPQSPAAQQRQRPGGNQERRQGHAGHASTSQHP